MIIKICCHFFYTTWGHIEFHIGFSKCFLMWLGSFYYNRKLESFFIRKFSCMTFEELQQCCKFEFTFHHYLSYKYFTAVTAEIYRRTAEWIFVDNPSDCIGNLYGLLLSFQLLFPLFQFQSFVAVVLRNFFIFSLVLCGYFL